MTESLPVIEMRHIVKKFGDFAANDDIMSVEAIDYEIFSFPPQWGVQFFVTCLYYSVILRRRNKSDTDL
ncbi:hypothetical protein GQS40_11845|uniref:Uncharacterized protein n=1 Tax=Leuconostoc lactis TaxID=1246 RepID=A0A6L7A7V0_LEULA|nr:hypothetical protein [Leuconostoc lactis]